MESVHRSKEEKGFCAMAEREYLGSGLKSVEECQQRGPPKDGTLDIEMDCTEEEEGGDESELAGSAVETFSTPMA